VSEANLLKYWELADRVDREEGMVAYARYNHVLTQIADKYEVELKRVVAAFCALSPTNTYTGNLRSAITVIKAVQDGTPKGEVVTTTYNHCRDRAYDYITGAQEFERQVKGPKIINFYWNILDPSSPDWCTVDGHMVSVWRDDLKASMKESIIKPREYAGIKAEICRVAIERVGILPQQFQATMWFVRKRLKKQGFDPQGSLFHVGDYWRTLRDVDRLEPF
jgi:hypothetical protein